METRRERRQFQRRPRPERRDTLVGTVTRVDTRDGGYGEYEILTVEQADGIEWAFHVTADAAKGQLEKAGGVEVGDEFAVRFDGTRTGKTSGRTYKA
jgi:hypothetical protein